jgi:hypothetical protein
MFSLWIASRDRLRLASAGLAVTTATASTAGARGLLSLVGGLGAVVVATSVAVTESYRTPLVSSCNSSSTTIVSHTGLVAGGHAATTAVVALARSGGGSLLGSIALANAGSGAVDGLGGGRRGSAGVELRVIACN